MFENVPDERLLALFELALRCTAEPTAKRPKFAQIVAELEIALHELTGEGNRMGEHIDKVREATAITLSTSLDDDLAAAGEESVTGTV